MTTKEAAAKYLAEHLSTCQGRPVSTYNPHGVSIDDLPVIYGFNNGGRSGWLEAVLLSQDGAQLGAHICSDEGYMPADLGVLEGTRPDRHETFREHYPDGYRMEFVPYEDIKTHAGFQEALTRGGWLREHA